MHTRSGNTNVEEVPVDVRDLPLDDQRVIDCYEGMLDTVLDRLATLNLHSFGIGNEIDAYLGVDSALWAQYKRFYSATRAHAVAQRPGLRVGTVATLDGLIGPRVDRCLLRLE